GQYEYGFRIGDYDRSRPLVIDPTVLIYAGYIGGTSPDLALGIAMDQTGNAYVTGMTASAEATFQVIAGPDTTINSPAAFDAFIAKVKADGSGLEYAGYIGGDGNDYGTSIAGAAGGRFDASVGPGVTFTGGLLDACVAKVKADGSGVVYAGYIGGGNIDRGLGIAVDGGGNAYVTGTTDSTEATFPVAGGPDL